MDFFANFANMKTEDSIRNQAEKVLGFDDNEEHVKQGTGQITTFNQLGFKGISQKPDGWYLPDDTTEVAIILETKAEDEEIDDEAHVEQLYNYMRIVNEHYHRVCGILYNSNTIRVFKYVYDSSLLKKKRAVLKWDDDPEFEEVKDCAPTLQNKSYYKKLFSSEKINKMLIYTITKRINDTLHVDFGIKNLYHRMIFTACALVAKRYGAQLWEGMDFTLLKSSILSTLHKSIEEDRKQNLKLDILEDVYAQIDMNYTSNQDAIDLFINCVAQISELVNSDAWHGEDVMGVFFNEFNRYKKKSERGQVLTPDHITSLMYRLLDVNKDDYVFDGTCGTGAFLVKSMSNMINEVGGVATKEAAEIKKCHLFGIEMDKELYALACANMLIHKDGKTNLDQNDMRSESAAKWLRSKPITKVLMNPPYERKYGCMEIVQNVLDNVKKGTKCAFILPDKKLEKDFTDKKFGNKLLRKHRLTTIVKLPVDTFFGISVTTSIFIFEAGIPQDSKNIIGYYIEDDGLETVKNQGRHDIHNEWQKREDYWVQAIHDGEDPKYKSKQIIRPCDHLSYQMPEKPFVVYEEDFMKTMMDYEMYLRGIDAKDFKEQITKKVLYSSDISEKNNHAIIKIIKDYE